MQYQLTLPKFRAYNFFIDYLSQEIIDKNISIFQSNDIDFQLQMQQNGQSTKIDNMLEIVFFFNNQYYLNKQVDQSQEELLKKIFNSYQKLLEISETRQKEQNEYPSLNQQIIHILLETSQQVDDFHLKKSINQTNKIQFHELFLYQFFKIANNLIEQQNIPILKNLNVETYLYNLEQFQIIQSIEFSQNAILKPIFKENEGQTIQLHSIFQKYQENIRGLARMFGGFKTYYSFIQEQQQKRTYLDFFPVSCLPMQIEYQQIKGLLDSVLTWNKLINNMAWDVNWINSLFNNSIDPFISKFLSIMNKAEQSIYANKINMAIIRNDFMLDSTKNVWKQVEFNTLSVGLLHISDTVQNFQETLCRSYLKQYVQSNNLKYYKSQNHDLGGEAFYKAYQIYGVENAKVLYIVEDEAWNLHDQRYSEVFLANKGVLCLRKTFEQLLLEATFDDKGRFFVDGDEICLVYFRWGYSPNHYYNEKIWELRENIELSRAIKCPNIKLILVNFKKIQLELQKQQVMDKFVEDQNQQKQINHQFAKIQELPEEEQEYQNLISDLEINFHKWVLKPNREGGGNNLYGTEIIQKLKEINKNDKKDYILMEKISQRPRIGHMLTHDDLKVCGAVSELSTWGAFISESQNNIDYNIQGGYLNRTKNFLSNEGGLAVGMSVLDGLLIKKDEE